MAALQSRTCGSFVAPGAYVALSAVRPATALRGTVYEPAATGPWHAHSLSNAWHSTGSRVAQPMGHDERLQSGSNPPAALRWPAGVLLAHKNSRAQDGDAGIRMPRPAATPSQGWRRAVVGWSCSARGVPRLSRWQRAGAWL